MELRAAQKIPYANMTESVSGSFLGSQRDLEAEFGQLRERLLALGDGSNTRVMMARR